MNILQTKVGSVEFSTPLILASGYITETPFFFLKAKQFGCAGMVTRSLRKRVPYERSLTPVPRYAVIDGDTMLNCEWGNEQPWTYWYGSWAEQVKNSWSPLIISLSGRGIASCKLLIRKFDEIGISAYEINISCSHSGALHGNLNINKTHLCDILEAIRQLTTTPIWIKLAYSPFVVEMAQEAERLGANAIVCTNTIGPGLLIDIETSQPRLGIRGGAGGISGKAIFPIALECVYQISQHVHVPVIGVGGISAAEDVLQMFMAGATAVQLYTLPALKGPAVFEKIIQGLKDFLRRHPEYKTITDIIGISHQWRKNHNFYGLKPTVLAEKCRGCGSCYASCAFNAIRLERGKDNRITATINDNCISCNACVGVCPPEFNAIKSNFTDQNE